MPQRICCSSLIRGAFIYYRQAFKDGLHGDWAHCSRRTRESLHLLPTSVGLCKRKKKSKQNPKYCVQYGLILWKYSEFGSRSRESKVLSSYVNFKIPIRHSGGELNSFVAKVTNK